MKKIIFFTMIFISINYIACNKSQLLNAANSQSNQEQSPSKINGLQNQAQLSSNESQVVQNQTVTKTHIPQNLNLSQSQSYEEDYQNPKNQVFAQKSDDETFQNPSSLNQFMKQNNSLLKQTNPLSDSQQKPNKLYQDLQQKMQENYLQEKQKLNLQASQSDHSQEQELDLKNQLVSSNEYSVDQYNVQGIQNQSKSQSKSVHQSYSIQDNFNPQDIKGFQNNILNSKVQNEPQIKQLSQEELQELNNHLKKQREESQLKKQNTQALNEQQSSQEEDFQARQSWKLPEMNNVQQKNQNSNLNKSAKIQQVMETPEPIKQKKPVLKQNSQSQESQEQVDQKTKVQDNGSQVQNSSKLQADNKELLRFQKYQNQQHEKSKLLRRSQSFAIKEEHGNSCNKDLLIAFGLKIDKSRENEEIKPQTSGVKEKTLCRRNMGTCCTYDEMMSVADDFAVTANKFREQFIVLEELYVMFKGTKIFDVLNDLKQHDQCKAMMEQHILVPKDDEGKPTGTFETTVAIDIQNNVAGLFNEMRRYKKHIISTYGNVVCSICSPTESKYFKLNEEKELQELDLTFANCQEIMDLKDFEIRVAEVYQKYLLPLVSIMECQKDEDDPKVDEIELDQFIEEKKAFENCFNDFTLDNPDCQDICTDFDIKTYTFPGNFFKVSKQMLTFFFKKFAGGDIAEYYQEYKDKDFHQYANIEHFVFYPELKVPKVEEDIYQADIQLVASNGINITNDYINRIFLEHNQHVSNSTIKIVISMIMLLLF